MHRFLPSLLLLPALCACAVHTPPITNADLKAAREAIPPVSESAADDAAAEAVKGILKDPDSAKLSYFPMQRGAFRFGDTLMTGFFVCGTVNAKNSYGGYVGQRVFFAHLAETIPTFATALIDSGDGTIAQLCSSIVKA